MFDCLLEVTAVVYSVDCNYSKHFSVINNYIVNNNHVRVELAVTKSLRIIAHSLAICFSIFKVQIQQTINYIQIAFELFEGNRIAIYFARVLY